MPFSQVWGKRHASEEAALGLRPTEEQETSRLAKGPVVFGRLARPPRCMSVLIARASKASSATGRACQGTLLKQTVSALGCPQRPANNFRSNVSRFWRISNSFYRGAHKQFWAWRGGLHKETVRRIRRISKFSDASSPRWASPSSMWRGGRV